MSKWEIHLDCEFCLETDDKDWPVEDGEKNWLPVAASFFDKLLEFCKQNNAELGYKDANIYPKQDGEDNSETQTIHRLLTKQPFLGTIEVSNSETAKPTDYKGVPEMKRGE